MKRVLSVKAAVLVADVAATAAVLVAVVAVTAVEVVVAVVQDAAAEAVTVVAAEAAAIASSHQQNFFQSQRACSLCAPVPVFLAPSCPVNVPPTLFAHKLSGANRQVYAMALRSCAKALRIGVSTSVISPPLYS